MWQPTGNLIPVTADCASQCVGFSLTEASQAEGEINVGAAFSAEAVLVFSDQGHSRATGLENCPCEHLGKVTTP